MIKIEKINLDKMIITFLRAELDSKRFSSKIRDILDKSGISKNIILEPDLGDKAEVEQRYSIFNSYRGYEDSEDLFAGFPRDSIVWYRASVSKEELLNNIYYIDYSYWNELSSGTRLPKIASSEYSREQRGLRRFK